MTNQEDRLRRVIGKVLFDINNYPERAQKYIAGTSTQTLNDRLTKAILTEGFCLPSAEAIPKLCNYGGCTYTADHTQPKEHSWHK